MPPVTSARSPLPKPVTEQLRKIPGGDQLMKIRERYSSNKTDDMQIRFAADIVINALLTGDTSDKDFEEAQDILARAGYKVGK